MLVDQAIRSFPHPRGLSLENLHRPLYPYQYPEYPKPLWCHSPRRQQLQDPANLQQTLQILGHPRNKNWPIGALQILPKQLPNTRTRSMATPFRTYHLNNQSNQKLEAKPQSPQCQFGLLLGLQSQNVQLTPVQLSPQLIPFLARLESGQILAQKLLRYSLNSRSLLRVSHGGSLKCPHCS